MTEHSEDRYILLRNLHIDAHRPPFWPPEEKRIAERDAWYVLGVDDVDNEIEVPATR